MGAHLVLRTEGHEETIIPLDNLPLVFGRGREVGLTLASPLVSRRHCEVYEADGKICVRDLESLNGTFVGEDRVSDIALSTGDLLTVGAATFEVVLEAENDDDAVKNSSDETLFEEATDLDAGAFEALDEGAETEAAESEVEDDGPTADEPTENVTFEDVTEKAGQKVAAKKKDEKEEPSKVDMPTIKVGNEKEEPSKVDMPAIKVGNEKEAPSKVDMPAIKVDKPSAAVDEDEDLDDFLKHFN